MAYHIDTRKVAGVVAECNETLKQHDFNHGEVIVGLAELIGRVIVHTATNHIAMKDMVAIVMEHLDRTVTVGEKVKNGG
jgi:hypothetical protein